MNFAIPFLFDSTTVRKFTKVGGYPMFYLDEDNSSVCAECVQEQVNSGFSFCPEIVAACVNYEDEHLACDECSSQIECAYGKGDNDI